MVNLEGKTIIYVSAVSSPPSQAGGKGETKTVCRDISNYAANFLLRGGRIKVIEPSQIHSERVALGLEKPKTERTANVTRSGNDGKADKGPAAEKEK